MLLSLIVTLVMTCPVTADDTTKVDPPKDLPNDSGDLAAAVKEIFRRNCAECHSDEDARADVRVLNHGELIDSDYIVPEKPDDSMIYQLITSTDEDMMPPSSRPALSGDDITTVRRWINAGAKAFPEDVASKIVVPSIVKPDAPEPDAPKNEPASEIVDKEILDVILQHIRTVPDRDRPFVRYFSLRHLVDGGLTAKHAAVLRGALAKAVNHLSRERDLVVPEPVDQIAGGTVLAIDLRKLGWNREVMNDIDNRENRTNVFDMVLLEYPYAIMPSDSDAYDRVRSEFLEAASQIRPIPFVRADWFCSVALQPPLYHDILQLPRTLGELEADLGVDVQTNLDDGIAKRAGMTVSGVSRNNRIVERHPHSDGFYWKSHDFATNTGAENILSNPIDFVPSGGEMIFRLPNGAQAYYVCDARGDRIDAAPTSIVVDKFASDRVVRNGLGCIRCHNAGIKDFNDVVHDVVKQLPGNPGFDKRKALSLYPSNAQWEDVVQKDRETFAVAMKKIDAMRSKREPLSVVTADYLEGTITLDEAADELGVDAKQLKTSCRTPGFTRLGLAPLAAGSVIRRDAWEHNFDAVVQLLGVGLPIVAIDGNSRTEFLPTTELAKIKLTTNKKNNFFEPGDTLRITVTNGTAKDVQFELYGKSVQGEVVRLTESVTALAAGGTFVFPPKGEEPIEIRGGVGRETITFYASTSKLPKGRICRGKNLADRVVHDFFAGETASDSVTTVMKKTISIETK